MTLRPAGWLFLTDQRLQWQADFEGVRLLGADSFSISLSSIVSVAQGMDWVGLNPSLRVKTADGLHVFWLGRGNDAAYDLIVRWLRALRRLGILLIAPNALDPRKPPVTPAVTGDPSDRR
jgi:hypothetical protein